MAGGASSPRFARDRVRGFLKDGSADADVEAATLIVSELVTNAVRHAGTGLRVAVTRVAEGRVRIGVTDRAPSVQVQVRISPEDDEGGRGLFLVEHLSAGWGSVSDGTGKTVWFELSA